MGSQHEVVVIGAGQAGLAVSYFLKKHGIEHVVIDRAKEVADSWRRRWDSMNMITPNWICKTLPGPEYPGEPDAFSSRADTVRYFDHWVKEVNPPLQLGVTVTRVEQADGGFAVHTAEQGVITARQVVVAVGPFQQPKVPAFADQVDKKVVQLHSSQYRNPDQFPPGSNIVVVGSGASGAQIAPDLARKHKVTLAQGSNPKIPRRVPGEVFQMIYAKMTRGGELELTAEEQAKEADFMWWMKRSGIFDAGEGHPFYDGAIAEEGDSDPYVGPDLEERASALGFTLAERVASVDGAELVLEDGTRVSPDVVIWATGWRRDLSWVKGPTYDKKGRPRQTRGVSADVPGLYFMGLRFMVSLSSAIMLGVARDAEHVASKVAERAAAR